MANFVALNEGLNRGIDLGGQLMDFNIRRESNRIARGQLDLQRQQYDDKRMLQRSQLFTQRMRASMSDHYRDPNAADFSPADFLTSDQASSVEAANILRHKLGQPDNVSRVEYGKDGQVFFVAADGKVIGDTTINDFQNQVAGHAAAFGLVDAVRMYGQMNPDDPQYQEMGTKVNSQIQRYSQFTGKDYKSPDEVIADATHSYLGGGGGGTSTQATTPSPTGTYVPSTASSPTPPGGQTSTPSRAIVPTETDAFYNSMPVLDRVNGSLYDAASHEDKVISLPGGAVTVTGAPKVLRPGMYEYMAKKLAESPDVTPGATITFDDAVTKIGGDPRAFKKDPQLVTRMIAGTPSGAVPPTVLGKTGAVVGNVARGVGNVLDKSAAGYGQMADDLKQGVGEFKAGMDASTSSPQVVDKTKQGNRPVIKLDALKVGDVLPGFDGSGGKATFRAADGSITEHPGAQPSEKYVKTTIDMVGTPKGNYRAAGRYLMMMSAVTGGQITDSMMKGFNDIASSGRLNGVELDRQELEKAKVLAQNEWENMRSFDSAANRDVSASNADLSARSRVYSANLNASVKKPVNDENSALAFLRSTAEGYAADEIRGGESEDAEARRKRADQLYAGMLNVVGNPQMLAQGGFAIRQDNQRPDWGAWSYFDLIRVAQSAKDGRTIDHNWVMPDKTIPGDSTNFDPAPIYSVANGKSEDPEAQRFYAFTSQLPPQDQQAFMGVYSDSQHNAVMKQLLMDNPNVPADQLMPYIIDYLQRTNLQRTK